MRAIKWNRVGLLMAFLVISIVGNSQENEILLINGKTIIGEVTNNDGEFITYQYKKKKSLFEKKIDILRVFSFTEDNKESVVYRQDTILGNVFSEGEMRMYIYGEKDSEKNFKGWPYFAGGLIGSYGISLFDTRVGKDNPDTVEDDRGFFKDDPSMMHFVTPFAGAMISGWIKPKIKIKHVSEDAYLANEQFVMGYQKNARVKRILNGLGGSLLGSVLGIITYSIAK